MINSGREAIIEIFDEQFSPWDVRLAPESIESRNGGHLFGGGWHIGYIWGAEGGQGFLEYLAQHRMTNDRHVRIWESGRIEHLPAPGPYVFGPNATNEEKARSKQFGTERNRLLYADLRAKGLLPPEGHNLSAHEINEYLRSGNEPPTGPGANPQQPSVFEPPRDERA